MDVKTYEAFTMKDAVKAVKRELGQDAVIISTRERASAEGGNRVFEVKAAAATKSSHQNGASYSSHVVPPLGDLGPIERKLAALIEEGPTKDQVNGLETGLREIKSLLIETLRSKDDSVLRDLPDHIVPLDRQLRAMGVDETYIADMVKHLRKLPDVKGDIDTLEEHVRANAIRWMMKRLSVAPKWTPMSGATSLQAIVGPSGAGKTALVGKLAAQYHIKGKANVRVISTDSQRLAAADQMRVFCKIINVPFHDVARPEDVRDVIKAHSDAELILIDTCGSSLRNDRQVQQLKFFEDDGIPVDFHLCLSVTEKQDQMDRAVRHFAPLGLQSLAFSKIDESWSFGEIFNLSRKWSLPLSFFSTGPQIPDDLERATRERVVERIFGL